MDNQDKQLQLRWQDNPDSTSATDDQILVDTLAQSKEIHKARVSTYYLGTGIAACTLAVLLLLFFVVVMSYTQLLVSSTSIPTNFWHIPLMLLFAITSLVALVLRTAAGLVRKPEHTAKEPTLPELPRETIDTITKFVEVIKK